MEPSCGCAVLVEGLRQLGIRHVLAVPGRPITHATELAAATHPGFEWAMNEKVAVEVAVGLSIAGVRSAVLVKQCGLNVGLDPLINAVFQTTGAALLVLVGDDVGARSSTVEQDSRDLARIACIPTLEPRDGRDVTPLVVSATSMSESMSTPVLVRLTHELHDLFRPSSTDPIEVTNRRPPPSDVAFALTKLGRQQHHRVRTWPRVQAAVDAGGHVEVHCGPRCGRGVLAVGAATRHLPSADQICRATTTASWPLPDEIMRFAAAHESVLVVEEPRPFVERELRLRVADGGRYPTAIRGRLTGHLPPEGLLTADMVATALAGDGTTPRWTTITRKSVDPAPDPPPYDVLFRVLAELRRAGAFVATDVGSSVKLCYPPYQGADSALCLGSAIGVASGAARAGRRSLAVIGDYALFHSGLEALIDIARRRLPVVVVVLLNGVQAQTGGQPSGAVTGAPGPDHRLTALIESTGVPVLGDLVLEDQSEAVLRTVLAEALDGDAPGLVMVRDLAGGPTVESLVRSTSA